MSFWDDDTAPADDARTRRERPGGVVVLLVVVILVVLLGGAWAAAAYAAEDKVPRGTTVAGVDIGGRAAPAAVETLEEGLAEREVAPIALQVGGRTFEVDPTEIGLSVDHRASVAAAGGSRSWHPQRLWDYFTGGDEVEPVVRVEESQMESGLQRLSRRAGRPARDGQVRLTRDGPRAVEPVNGTGLDPDATREALLAAYLDPEPLAEVELSAVEPVIDAADVRTAMTEFAEPALSAPVTLRFDGTSVRLPPAALAPALSMVTQRGRLAPRVDQRRIRRVVERRGGAAGSEPVDADVRLVDGRPEVVPARPGVTYTDRAITGALRTALVRPEGERSVAVRASEQAAEVSTRDIRRLGIRGQVSEFTTYYPDAEYRNVNLGRAAELVDGTLLEPGEVFSLNDVVGERTRENGFTEGFVISDGILLEDLGGGVSQMATTLFNAMYFAGLEDVEHSPHSFYIDRYPVGREATVAWGSIDLRFRNDTEHGVLIDADVTPSTSSSEGVVTVRMFSTKVWDISSRNSDRYNYTEPETRVLDTEDCYAYTGSPGFEIDVYRTFRRPGSDEVVRTETFHTLYTPSDGVECVPAG